MTKTIQLGEPPMTYTPAIIHREKDSWRENSRREQTNPDRYATPPKGFEAELRNDPFESRHTPTARRSGFVVTDTPADENLADIPSLAYRNSNPGQLVAPKSPKATPRHFGQVLYTSPSMKAVHRQLVKVAATEATVFIIGQTGTGKELVARCIHTLSKRSKNEFFAVNCGAIAANLVESELFGHERGSFTGAQQVHKGHFERASGGTLLLDEITEMQIELQVKLLRVLETGRIMRVGGTKEIEVDVRVVAATNRDPMEAVREGKLREDLMYRLSVFPLYIPALKDRGNEALLLAEHFLRKLNRQNGTDKFFSENAKAKIAAHSWPGNVRELKNLISRVYILADDVIGPELIPSADGMTIRSMVVETPAEPAPEPAATFAPVGTSLAEVEKQLIVQTLRQNGGNKPQTAEMLGISLKTLYNRLNSYRSEEIQ